MSTTLAAPYGNDTCNGVSPPGWRHLRLHDSWVAIARFRAWDFHDLELDEVWSCLCSEHSRSHRTLVGAPKHRMLMHVNVGDLRALYSASLRASSSTCSVHSHRVRLHSTSSTMSNTGNFSGMCNGVSFITKDIYGVGTSTF